MLLHWYWPLKALFTMSQFIVWFSYCDRSQSRHIKPTLCSVFEVLKKKSNHKMAAGEKINIVSFALYTIKGELFAYFLSCAFFICFLYITKRTMTPKISEFLIRRIFRMCVLLFTGKYYLHNMSDSNHSQIWLLSLNVLDSQPVNVKISYILLHFDQLT